ncbi:MAG: DUF3822 family protein [Bacteroidota bacterium]
MTKKATTSILEKSAKDYYKLSIQVSLNGLSFCVLDTIGNKILASESISFEKDLSPYEVQKRLATHLEKHQISDATFSEVVVIHRNNLFSLVPKALFDENELPNYLKFNTKILANDLIVFDEIESYDIVNVYVPFVNINNYIYDLFGEFEFRHTGTVMVHTLLNSHSNGNESTCYVHVSEQQMDITVLSQKKLHLFNSFNFYSREDFIYYLLFTLEQLKLDTETVKLRLFGIIEEGDDIYDLCYEYVKNVSIFIPSNTPYHLGELHEESIDFTVLNAL